MGRPSLCLKSRDLFSLKKQGVKDYSDLPHGVDQCGHPIVLSFKNTLWVSTCCKNYLVAVVSREVLNKENYFSKK